MAREFLPEEVAELIGVLETASSDNRKMKGGWPADIAVLNREWVVWATADEDSKPELTTMTIIDAWNLYKGAQLDVQNGDFANIGEAFGASGYWI